MPRFLLAALLAFLLVPQVADARDLRLGLMTTPWLEDVEFTESAAVGAELVRMQVSWASIAPTRPADPANPADPAYAWADLDAAVRAADARDLEVILCPSIAPRWAEGPNRPRGVRAGAWRPDAAAYAAFSRAAAERYSGRGGLPRVRYWQAWNEPNMPMWLAPQHIDGRPAAPGIYRGLLNGMAQSVRSVASDNLVLAGNTAPFGDEPHQGLGRTRPVRFLREVLSQPTSFDILAHHPYSVRGPFTRAFSPEDVTVADVDKLKRVFIEARRRGNVPRSQRPRLWVTELSWDSKPDPFGLSQRKQAQWLQESLYVLWRSRVEVVTWSFLRDRAPRPNYGATNQGGILLLDGRPKVSLRAYQLPLVLRRSRPGFAKVWTRAGAAGVLRIQRRRGRGWTTVRTFRVTRGDVVFKRLRLGERSLVRARLGRTTSLSARVR